LDAGKPEGLIMPYHRLGGLLFITFVPAFVLVLLASAGRQESDEKQEKSKKP
jgi:hypothetical protein